MIGCMYKGLGHEMNIFWMHIIKQVLTVHAQIVFDFILPRGLEK
jgi:hypothetical protein